MIGQIPAVERLDAASAPATWQEALARVAAGKSRALIERGGKPLAALISVEEYRLFLRMDEQRREDLATLSASWDAFADVPGEELEREIAKALAEVRAERGGEDGRAAQSA